jgi:mono/diheme cytochrome c family protein
VRAVLAVSLVLVVAGCGRASSSIRGHEVFGRACSRCHTLTGRDTGARGGDLAVLHLGTAAVVSFTSQMPVRLSDADVRAVSAYVVSRERRR